jgi:hypothetical protein
MYMNEPIRRADMSLRVSMHKPLTAAATTYPFTGGVKGCVSFSDGSQEFELYTTPEAAKAVADAFNAAMQAAREDRNAA